MAHFSRRPAGDPAMKKRPFCATSGEGQSEIYTLKTKLEKSERDRKNAELLQNKMEEDINNLSAQLSITRSELASCRQDLVSQQATFDQETARLRDELRQAQRGQSSKEYSEEGRLHDIEEKNVELQSTLRLAEADLKQSATQCESLAAQLALVQSQNEKLRESMAQQNDRQAECTMSQATVEELRGKLDAQQDYKAMYEKLKESQSKKPSTPSADRTHNVEMLKEEIESLKHTLQRMRESSNESEQMRSRLAELESERVEWTTVMASFPELKSPTDVAAFVSQLQVEKEALVEKQGESAEKIIVLESTLAQLKAQIHTSEEEAEALQTKASEAWQEVCKSHRTLTVTQKERDMYKSLLDSYSKEHSLSSSEDQQVAGKRLADLQADYTVVTEKNRSLECEISTYKTTQMSLQARVCELELLLQAGQEEAKGAAESARIAALTAENQAMLKEIEKLEHAVEVYEGKVAKGEFDPQTTKVLHMTFNPEREAYEKQQALKAKQREEDLVLQHEKLKKEMEQSRKKLDRVSKIYGDQTRKFREVCRTLFGYSIQPVDKDFSTYQVASVFAHHPSKEFLSFKLAAQGGMELLETDYCQRWSQQIEQYLANGDSFPAFLAAVTLQLFQARHTTAS